MARRVETAAIFVLVIALASVAVASERTSDDPARSFTDLRTIVTPGDRLIVRDTSGRNTTGRLVSLSGAELEISRRRWNFRTEHRTWTETSVSRIDRKDSTWNGSVIGAAAGLLAIAKMVNSSCDLRCLPFAVAAVPVGVTIGEAIDGAVNVTIYESPPARSGMVHPLRNRGIVVAYRRSLFKR